MTALEYRGVGFEYPHAHVALVDVTLAFGAGTLTVVTGSSGSGKSTLLRAANGLVPHSSGGTFRGDVIVAGRSTRDHRPRDLVDVVGFVHQDPEAQFVVDHVEADLAFALENLGVDPPAMRRRVEEALDMLGVAHLRDRDPATLSGGERQRCAIAGALVAQPQVLVLDEPTSQLDPQGADDVVAALVRLNHDLGTTIVIAEHRLDRIAAFADRCLVLDRGRVVADGVPRDVLGDYAGAPMVTRLGNKLGWDPLPLTVKEARAHAGAGRARSHGAAADISPPADVDVLVRARGAGVTFDGVAALVALDLTVRAGSVVALLGRNGAGKTTALRALAGLVRTTGTVERPARVGYVPQDPNALLHATTVRDEVRTTARLLRMDHTGIDRWIDRVGLRASADRHPRDLSGGERQRVAVAAVAVGEPRLLLLDEPTRGMDAPSRDALANAIAEHARGGGAVVLATHDVELAARVAHEVVVLGDGEVVAAGDARSVLSGSMFAPAVLRLYPPALTLDEIERID